MLLFELTTPDRSYALTTDSLAAAVGGTYFPLGTEGIHLNPLDLPIHTRPDGRRSAPADAVTRHEFRCRAGPR